MNTLPSGGYRREDQTSEWRGMSSRDTEQMLTRALNEAHTLYVHAVAELSSLVAGAPSCIPARSVRLNAAATQRRAVFQRYTEAIQALKHFRDHHLDRM